MAIKLTSLRADLKRENEGDWVDIPELPGLRLKVRGGAYGPYQAAKSIVEGKWARRYGRNPVPVEELLRENGRLYAEFILVDWQGLDDGGEPVSVEQARDILTDPAFRDLHEHIRYAMLMVSQTEAEFVEDAAKNSSASSAGGSKEAT